MQRQAMWSQQIEAFAGPCAMTYGEASFEGHFSMGRLAGFTCARLRHNARAVQRSRRDLAHTDHGFYCLILLLSGCSTVMQDDRSCVLRPGDLALLDGSQPGGMHFGPAHEQLTVHVPREAVNRLAGGRLRVATALRGAPAMVLGALLRPTFGEQDAFNAAQNDAIAEALLKLVAASWQSSPAEPARLEQTLPPAPLLRLIQEYAASNLASPGLDPQTVADVHRVSVRHVHRLFHAAGTTFGEWLRNCRLERCAADLHDRARSASSITEIAFRWGFNESAHFSRAFKAVHGVSPREYRQACFDTKPREAH